jgi:hypothetical protein
MSHQWRDRFRAVSMNAQRQVSDRHAFSRVHEPSDIALVSASSAPAARLCSCDMNVGRPAAKPTRRPARRAASSSVREAAAMSGERVLPLLEIGRVDEVADRLERAHNL